MASRGNAATRLKTTGTWSEYVDDPHITCLDTFSLNPVQVSHTPGPLEAFCQIPSDNPQREDPDTITLAPGLDVIDFYVTSEKSEVWKNDAPFECLVPRALQGWEFYTLLHPKPEGSFPVVINPDSTDKPKIEMLFGRPPGAQQCPSMLFLIVPAGQQYQIPQTLAAAAHQGPSGRQMMSRRARGGEGTTPFFYEKACGNLDDKGQSLRPRLLALCPNTVYDETAVLPDGASWGLFVGPRHRRLLLLNKSSGRIDVHMLMLFSIDAVFRRGGALVEATARLYEPFGTAEQAKALFLDFDPLKAHCGLTNAVIADHVSSSTDGRDDYRRLLGVWPHSFFVSNSSDNMRFLTPLEVQHHREGRDKEFPDLPWPHKLEDFPQWVVGPGVVEADHRTAMRKYRTRVIPNVTKKDQKHEKWQHGVLQLLGLHSAGDKEDPWSQMVSKLGGCAEVTFAGSQPWQEPGKVINARPVVEGTAGEQASGGALPLRGVHWRHSQDLIPGADLNEVTVAGPVAASPEPAAAAFAPAIAEAPPPAPAATAAAPRPQPSGMPDSVACRMQPPPQLPARS